MQAVNYLYKHTDIMNNTLGALIEWMLYKAIEKAFGNRVKTKNS